MVTHIVNAGIRALAASIILGTILIYAVGGLSSPNARPLIGVIVVGFFIFWLVFIFLFGPGVPNPDARTRDGDLDDYVHFSSRGRRRKADETGHDGEVSEGGGGDGGGGGSD